MQTFLPFPDYAASAQALDGPRLGKQRVENLQIMKALLVGGGWSNHPAVKMWRGHEAALLDYQRACCHEWTAIRGHTDTCLSKTIALFEEHGRPGLPEPPAWFGNPDVHISHQSNLIRKDPERYGPLFPGVPGDLPYCWPS